MNLIKKEVREIGLPGILMITFLAIGSGIVFKMPLFETLSSSLFVMGSGFFVCMMIASILGAMAVAGDKDRGTLIFLKTLPISKLNLWFTKTLTALGITTLIYPAYCGWFHQATNDYWPVLILVSFAFANLFGIILPFLIHGIMMGILASILSLYSVWFFRLQWHCSIFVLNLGLVCVAAVVLVISYLVFCRQH